MLKITWDLAKEEFPNFVHSVLICENCGWLIYNPKLEGGKFAKVNEICDNCRIPYTASNSKIQRIGGIKK